MSVTGNIARGGLGLVRNSARSDGSKRVGSASSSPTIGYCCARSSGRHLYVVPAASVVAAVLLLSHRSPSLPHPLSLSLYLHRGFDAHFVYSPTPPPGTAVCRSADCLSSYYPCLITTRLCMFVGPLGCGPVRPLACACCVKTGKVLLPPPTPSFSIA